MYIPNLRTISSVVAKIQNDSVLKHSYYARTQVLFHFTLGACKPHVYRVYMHTSKLIWNIIGPSSTKVARGVGIVADAHMRKCSFIPLLAQA